MTSKKEILLRSINELSEDKINLIYELLSLPSYPNKDNLLKLSGKSESEIKKIDSAVPINYIREIEKIYPQINEHNLCYDYNKDNLGKLVSIDVLIARKILQTFKP